MLADFMEARGAAGKQLARFIKMIKEEINKEDNTQKLKNRSS